MDQKRLRDIIDAYGADPSRWPDQERDAALDLLEASPEAFQEQLESHKALDDVLDLMNQDSHVPRSLKDKLSVSLTEAPARPASIPTMPRWAGMAAAIALTAGLGLGWFGADYWSPGSDLSSEDEYYADAFSAISADAGWDLEEPL